MKVGRMPVAMNSPIGAAVGVDADLLEGEDLLHDDRVAFHADDLGDAGHLARAALEPAGLDDQVDGRGELRPQGADRQLEAGHADHGLEPARGRRAGVLAWTVVIEPSWPVFMAWIMSSVSAPRHSPMMIRSGRIRRAFLTRSVAVTAPRPSMLGGPRLQPDDVVLLELQLGRVLDRDHAMVGLDEAGERVQQRRLARAGAARDDDVQPRLHRPFHQREHLGRERLEAEQVVLGERLASRTSGS